MTDKVPTDEQMLARRRAALREVCELIGIAKISCYTMSGMSVVIVNQDALVAMLGRVAEALEGDEPKQETPT